MGLDDNVFRDYAARLIPRAVGYSAALLDYFFRGRLDVDLADDGSGLRLVGANGSDYQFNTSAGARRSAPGRSVRESPLGPPLSACPGFPHRLGARTLSALARTSEGQAGVARSGSTACATPGGRRAGGGVLGEAAAERLGTRLPASRSARALCSRTSLAATPSSAS